MALDKQKQHIMLQIMCYFWAAKKNQLRYLIKEAQQEEGSYF